MDAVTSLLPVEIRGTAESTATMGAVRIDPEGPLDDIVLRAERLVIDHAWQRSARVQALQMNMVLERGETSVPLDAAEVRFAQIEGQPQLLALADVPVQLQIRSPDGLSLKPDSNLTLVDVGMNPQALSVGDAPGLGFWYTTDGPTVIGSGDGRVTLRGTFSLFVHNLSITAHGDGDTWSDWTGHRQSQPDGPATDAELRITVLHVTNGTLYVPSPRPVLFAVPQTSVHMDGLLSLESAAGELIQRGRKLLLEQEPLILAGTGEVRLVAVHSTGGGPPHLSIRPQQGLDILTTTGSWTESRPASGRSASATALGAGATAVGLTAFAVLLEVGVVPGTTPVLARGPHNRWMRRGRRAAKRDRWTLAAWCYRNAVRTKEDDPLAWYDWAGAELKAGRWGRADQIAERAVAVPGIDPADLLELRASSAWLAGDHDACRDHLDQLAREEPAMAMGLVKDLQIDLTLLGGPGPSLRRAHKMEEPPYGYA